VTAIDRVTTQIYTPKLFPYPGRIVNHSSVLDSLTLLSKNPKMFGGFVYKQIERSASCGFGGQVHFLPDAQFVSCTVVAVPSISCSLTCL